ncbi:MAG: DUF2927 domain-containing protein [Pseudomonadota bacterium]
MSGYLRPIFRRLGRTVKLSVALAATLAAAGCSPAVTGADLAWFEQGLRAEGKLRTDRAPADAPFDQADLARNFGLIAFGLEPQLNDGRTASMMTRWEEPIRWNLFAPSGERDRVRRDITATFARISELTGIPVSEEPDDSKSNFDILVLGARDYGGRVAWARERVSENDAELIAGFRNSEILCRARTYHANRDNADRRRGGISYALILIRAGYSDAFRLSCVEEELVQAMGLSNDDRSVRPSIFNDDEEFALLTTHDELLLRILYDPRLRPGMDENEARPVVRRIAGELYRGTPGGTAGSAEAGG